MGKSSGSSQTTTTNYPEEYKRLLAKGEAITNKLETSGYQPYEGPRVADATADQQAGWAGVRDYAATMPDLTNDWLSRLRTYADAPAQSITPQTISTEDILSKNLKAYMNPYTDAVVNPQLRELDTSLEKNLNKVGGLAARSGSFGDARHGLLEGELYKNAQTARSDIVGKGNADAFNNAVALATGDINRKLQTDTYNASSGTDAQKTNANLFEQMLGRLKSGAESMPATQAIDQQNQLQALQALLSSGGQQQAINQQKLDADYQEFLRDYGHLFNVLTAMQGTTAAASRPESTTTTTKTPDNSGLGLLGSLGAALITKI